jgi:hypothetical protein
MAVAAVSLVLYWPGRSQVEIVVEASLWIYRSPANSASPPEKVPLGDDFLPMHAALLKSPLMIDNAVKKYQLDALASLAGKDAAAAIREGLSVTADPTVPKSILILRFRGTSAGDAEAVLNALINSYTAHFDDSYRKRDRLLR